MLPSGIELEDKFLSNTGISYLGNLSCLIFTNYVTCSVYQNIKKKQKTKTQSPSVLGHKNESFIFLLMDRVIRLVNSLLDGIIIVQRL